jgi:hypothetical protein
VLVGPGFNTWKNLLFSEGATHSDLYLIPNPIWGTVYGETSLKAWLHVMQAGF